MSLYIAPNCPMFTGTPFMLPIPLFILGENMHNSAITRNRVFQGEIIFNLFHIHCELRASLIVKTAKKRGISVLLFLYNAWNNPTPFLRVKSHTKTKLFL